MYDACIDFVKPSAFLMSLSDLVGTVVCYSKSISKLFPSVYIQFSKDSIYHVN